MSRLVSLRTALLLGVVSLTGCGALPNAVVEHVDDGEHPLSLQSGGGGSSVMPPEDWHPGDTWEATFGAFLPCVEQGDGPLVITDVSWNSDPGPEPVSVKLYLRTYDDATSDPYGSMLGTPVDNDDPDFTGTVVPGVKGFEVVRTCSDVNDLKGEKEEIMVAVTSGSAGAHVGELRVSYESPSGREYALVTDWDMWACGTETPQDLCSSPEGA